MLNIRARNVNEAYRWAGLLLKNLGMRQTTRNGSALVFPEPVTTHYDQPKERVLFHHARDANPFFHLFEALWMLAGRRDVGFLKRFISNIDQFSDDGETFHGAYGYRWREHFGVDQLHSLCRVLRQDPGTRRAVIAMFDPAVDLEYVSNDIPCNTTIKFEQQDGKLNMVVFNRSNDLLWGCYGANVVQFSMLQQVIAEMVGMEVGWYEQVSCNLHAYHDPWMKHEPWLTADSADPYTRGEVRSVNLVDHPTSWWVNLTAFLDWTDQVEVDPELRWSRPVFGNVWFSIYAVPLYHSHKAYRMKLYQEAVDVTNYQGVDWNRACREWLFRRPSVQNAVGVPAEQP